MDVKHFRIGNLVTTKYYDENNEEKEVVADISAISENEDLGEGFKFILTTGLEVDVYHGTRPIELTEEILNANDIADCGMRTFKIKNSKYFLIEWGGLNSCNYAFGMKGEFGNAEIISEPFSTVNQLQNLYFALTGEELKINL